jgi:hypothetical protein
MLIAVYKYLDISHNDNNVSITDHVNPGESEIWLRPIKHPSKISREYTLILQKLFWRRYFNQESKICPVVQVLEMLST